ncbi:parvulin-like peptidyl-prolyl isomerase [Desulfitobacterium dehalogenans ATCC 51507]|uniref:peptidylprolyl isomerase n=1 Tax=Desulfitobacterium dehalogenans (strain ATCC 51507 / DSM 9161 / JW/IU-DC1) TaxID=756499 RepID=I4A3R0_DESDJ|nr:peptidylprolyl isomerase [Desulfitobacterium dehalogenans]AFL98594.1 parvulin-like peptidyl-prolyl isomerase [Desulfitobacterium dehalogenans ATCC 51507]
MRSFRNGIIAALLVSTLILAGCSSAGGNQWVAKVNGETITEQDFAARVSNVQKTYEGMGMDFSTEQGKEALEEVKSQILEAMIASRLVIQEAQRLSLDPNDPSILEQEKNIIQMVGDETQYQEWLKQQAMTEDEVRSYFALSAEITKDVTVTKEQEKTFFDNNQELYGGKGEEVQARHILVPTEDEAKAIIKQLDGGADFAELAKEKSTDTGSQSSGGYLGSFGKGRMVPEFEAVAFAQEVGTYTKTPVKSEFGYHIILVEDHKAATKADYEAVKDQVAEDALADAKAQKFESYFSELQTKAEANIEYSEKYKPAS